MKGASCVGEEPDPRKPDPAFSLPTRQLEDRAACQLRGITSTWTSTLGKDERSLSLGFMKTKRLSPAPSTRTDVQAE